MLLFDHGEQRSGVPAELARLGVEVQGARLPAGDYVVSDRLVVERKRLPVGGADRRRRAGAHAPGGVARRARPCADARRERAADDGSARHRRVDRPALPPGGQARLPAARRAPAAPADRGRPPGRRGRPAVPAGDLHGRRGPAARAFGLAGAGVRRPPYHEPSGVRPTLESQPRMFTARATTRAIVSRAVIDWMPISTLAVPVSGSVSVGLNATLLVSDV